MPPGAAPHGERTRPRRAAADKGNASRRRTAAVAALGLLLLACERPSDRTAVARTPTPLDPATTGTITGTTRFTGDIPAPVLVALDPDPTCRALHPGGLAIPEVRVSGERLADVFVYVKRGLDDRVFRVPDDPVVVDQRGCLFVPRVVGVQAGQPVRFVNSDTTLHNVHGMPARSPAWNFAMGEVGATRTVTIDTPEVPVPIRCEVHAWMRAELAVVDHPYYAVTGTTGTFTLANVPAGDYDLAAWHPRLGAREQRVTVAPGTRATADFTFGGADERTDTSPTR